MCVYCWPREEVVRCGVTDVFDVVCGVRIVSKGVGCGLFADMTGTM